MTPGESSALTACRGFHELTLDDTDWAGGKGANLGELTGMGIAVPSGFVVGAPAYASFCDSTGLRTRLAETLDGLDPEDTADLQARADAAHELSLQTAVPHAIAAQIGAAYDRLRADDHALPVAVRSSAIGEDAAGHSFAGMHSSFLNVRGEQELLSAVRRCWASLLTARTLYYRASHGLPLAEMDIAVVVQKQLSAGRSGVMFTIDPTTGREDRLVIEASLGLGEAIVSGAVSPDQFVFAKDQSDGHDPMLVEKRINRKDLIVEQAPDGGTRERRPGHFAATRAAILESEAAQIARTGLRIEAHYGCAQDIEWALDVDGALWIVQSRPITATGADRATAASAPGGERGGVLLSGVGAGPGLATGPVRIVESPRQAGVLQEGEVLVAHATRPDWVPLMRRAAGIITDTGGVTSHAAIVARELAIPTVVGTTDATTTLSDGQVVTIDAPAGVVLSGQRRRQDVPSAAGQQDAPTTPVEQQPQPSAPSPHTRTKLLVNLSDSDQAELAAAREIDGVGLLRAEVLVVHALGGRHPQLLVEEGRGDEFVDRMAEQLIRFAAAFDPRPITYRTIDFRTNEFRDLEGGERFEPVEDNPMIGMRGAQRYLRDPEFFALELEAVARVHAAGHRNLHVMLPFVRSAAELARCCDLIERSGLTRLDGFELWVMAEVPSVLFFLDQLPRLGVVGISIGTNDLTQLLLGADRDSAALAEIFDARDPAVIAYLQQLIPRAKQLGLATSICGQAPSVYPEYAQLLVAAGIDAISVSLDAADATRANIAAAEQANPDRVPSLEA
jgi:pyruvate,water dikinase